MDSNRDEALRCLKIAQRHREAANYPSAKKFCEKSLLLYSTPEAQKLLDIVLEEAKVDNKDAIPSSSSTGADVHPSASTTKQRTASTRADSSTTEQKKREYTPGQIKLVKRVQSCSITGYYEILEVKKDCDENDVKKAYRKVRLVPFSGVSKRV